MRRMTMTRASILFLLISPSWAFGPDRAAVPAPAAPAITIEGAADAGQPRLRCSDARRQLVVTGVAPTGELRDVTRDATFEISPAGVVQVDGTGFLTPLADGKAKVVAKSAEGIAGE